MSAAPVARTPAQSPAKMKRPDHHRLWRLVEGAVLDAFANHPEYLTEAGKKSAVQSVTKRVVGQIVGHATEAQARGSLGTSRPSSVARPVSGADAAPTASAGDTPCKGVR